jgi:DNA-binding transcriptional LysR family regulator
MCRDQSHGSDFHLPDKATSRSHAIDAAVDGQGVALARTALATWDLIGGRLVRPFAVALAVPYAYWIVCPKATARLPKIVAFTNWLLAEAAEDVKRLQNEKTNSASHKNPFRRPRGRAAS